jgi:hypothetical protein
MSALVMLASFTLFGNTARQNHSGDAATRHTLAGGIQMANGDYINYA